MLCSVHLLISNQFKLNPIKLRTTSLIMILTFSSSLRHDNLHDNLRDSLILSAATPPGYAYLNFPRHNRRGGGIAVFHNKCLKINLLKEHHSDAREAIELAVKLGSNQLNVVIVYRAPSLSFRLFLDLMRDIFGRLVTSSQRRLLCVGDFNIHMDNEHDHKTKSIQKHAWWIWTKATCKCSYSQVWSCIGPGHIWSVLSKSVTWKRSSGLALCSCDFKSHFCEIWKFGCYRPKKQHKMRLDMSNF